MSAERNVINNHRLRGSASTVLTANCLEIGKCKIRPLAESKPLSRSTEKLSWVIRSARRPAVPNLVQTSVVFRDWGQSCPGVPSPSLSSFPLPFLPFRHFSYFPSLFLPSPSFPIFPPTKSSESIWGALCMLWYIPRLFVTIANIDQFQ